MDLEFLSTQMSLSRMEASLRLLDCIFFQNLWGFRFLVTGRLCPFLWISLQTLVRLYLGFVRRPV